ncbi:hypothetical protein KY343_01875 [Candidatus Woesearchaeota archaeon]|nr:hypothetical protein [Candidatus Woesearchaeota archaeon]
MKTKKRAKKTKPKLNPKKDLVLEEHVVKLLEKQNKREIKQSIDAVVKKEAKKETKTKKTKKPKVKTKDIYRKARKDEYRGLQGSGVYDQIKFSNFSGFIYKSNIKGNDEFYQSIGYENVLEKHQAGQAERNIVSSEELDNYGRKTMMNFLIGSPMMTSGMSAVSFEEMEMTKFSLYDRTQNLLYTAKLKIMGFGDQSSAFGAMFSTTLKTMHAPMNDKAA